MRTMDYGVSGPFFTTVIWKKPPLEIFAYARARVKRDVGNRFQSTSFEAV